MDTASSSKTERKFICVVYPGIVKNSEKALRNLGGIDRLSEDFHANRNLELKNDPDNVYERAVFSQKTTAVEEIVTVVVKARRRKNKNSQGEEYYEVQSEVLGLVETMHEFKSMWDFQLLPVQLKRTEESGEKVYQDLTSKLFPYDIPTAISWLNPNREEERQQGDDESCFLPPFVFSRYQTPSTYVLAKEVEHKDAALKARRTRTDVIGVSTRSGRKALSVTVANEDTVFPSEPSLAAVTTADQRVRNVEVHETFRKLFEERPIWVRNAIQVKTGFDNAVIKWVIGKYAFYIISGPWGRAWCRFGYDPRRESEAVQYQTLMVQFRHFDPITPRNRLRLSKTNQMLTGRESFVRTTDAKKESSYRYTSGFIPEFRQVYYSICDIDLPIAKQYLNDSLCSLRKVVSGQVADPAYGFLPAEAPDTIRQALLTDLFEQYSKTGEGKAEGDRWMVQELEMDEVNAAEVEGEQESIEDESIDIL